MRSYIVTAESVTEGHPDKVADLIADTILDAVLTQDSAARVAVEVLCKGPVVVLAGEVTARARVDYEGMVREAVREVGYDEEGEPFCADTLSVVQLISPQSGDIAAGIGSGDDQGAGDQGTTIGYATDETPELMPLPILLAHRLARGLAEDRRSGRHPWLRPDGKTQVAVLYEGDRPVAVERVLVSAQHRRGVDRGRIEEYAREEMLPERLGEWWRPEIRLLVNPAGDFVEGGPGADCGLTGRKIIVDTYGGAARHGGGAFSGKDPSKVDRSGAYYCRYVARQVVKEGLARRVEVAASYAIGEAEPFSLMAETFGTGDERAVEAFIRGEFDFRPAAMIRQLGLREPIYRKTTNYGHFGREGLPWEM